MDLHHSGDRLVAEAEVALMQMTEPTQVFDKVVMEEQEQLILAAAAEVVLVHPEVMTVMEPQEVLELLL